ncbi:MAG: hypothetical protein WAZ98_03890 [Cyclobacteriaceae bacterium]
MHILFTADAPHTRREGSKKNFKAGKTYFMSADYAQEFIEKGVAKEVKPVDLDDFKPKRNKKN